MKRNTYRIPFGFLAGAIYIIRARPSFASFLCGVVVMLFGECIRFVSSGTLIKFEGVTRNGIYAYVRNPLYIGSFFIGTGACIMGRDPVFAVLFLVAYPLIYYRIIRREEGYLVRRYGDDYRRYLREVPGIVPRGFSLREVLGETAPFLAMKNREYLTVTGIIAVWGIMALKMGFMEGG